MPVNNWKHQLFLTDLLGAFQQPDHDFERLRTELVTRIREADFYDEDDIVLRDLTQSMQAAGSLTALSREWDLLHLWADQGQRVWLETTFTREQFDEHQRRTGRT